MSTLKIFHDQEFSPGEIKRIFGTKKWKGEDKNMSFGKNSSIQTTLTSNSSNLEEQTIDQALNLSEQMVGKTSMFYAECIFKTR